MKKCPRCGYIDHPYWRNSRYELNAEYCTYEEFKDIRPDIKTLPHEENGIIYYLRGRYPHVYRVSKEDYKVPRERHKH